jgi:hypothetical protein
VLDITSARRRTAATDGCADRASLDRQAASDLAASTDQMNPSYQKCISATTLPVSGSFPAR